MQVAGSPRILSLVLNSSGSHLAAICYDRVIRLYEVTSYSGRAARRKSFTANEVIGKTTGRHQVSNHLPYTCLLLSSGQVDDQALANGFLSSHMSALVAIGLPAWLGQQAKYASDRMIISPHWHRLRAASLFSHHIS